MRFIYLSFVIVIFSLTTLSCDILGGTECDDYQTRCDLTNGCQKCRYCREANTDCIGELECTSLGDCRENDYCSEFPDTICDPEDGVCKLNVPESCEVALDCGIAMSNEMEYMDLVEVYFACNQGVCEPTQYELYGSCEDNSQCEEGFAYCSTGENICRPLYTPFLGGQLSQSCGDGYVMITDTELPFACPYEGCILGKCVPLEK